jgi:hypothetical protein
VITREQRSQGQLAVGCSPQRWVTLRDVVLSKLESFLSSPFSLSLSVSSSKLDLLASLPSTSYLVVFCMYPTHTQSKTPPAPNPNPEMADRDYDDVAADKQWVRALAIHHSPLPRA